MFEAKGVYSVQTFSYEQTAGFKTQNVWNICELKSTKLISFKVEPPFSFKKKFRLKNWNTCFSKEQFYRNTRKSLLNTLFILTYTSHFHVIEKVTLQMFSKQN